MDPLPPCPAGVGVVSVGMGARSYSVQFVEGAGPSAVPAPPWSRVSNTHGAGVPELLLDQALAVCPVLQTHPQLGPLTSTGTQILSL